MKRFGYFKTLFNSLEQLKGISILGKSPDLQGKSRESVRQNPVTVRLIPASRAHNPHHQCAQPP